MKFNETTIRILVRKNYGECFDFYTKKLGLIAIWGDRNGLYFICCKQRYTTMFCYLFRGSDVYVSGLSTA